MKVAILQCIMMVLAGCATPYDHSVIEIERGYFKANLERLAIEYNLTPIVWDERVKSCHWRQKTAYQISASSPELAIAQYVEKIDFKIEVSKVDRHMKVVYVGPLERLVQCG